MAWRKMVILIFKKFTFDKYILGSSYQRKDFDSINFFFFFFVKLTAYQSQHTAGEIKDY